MSFHILQETSDALLTESSDYLSAESPSIFIAGTDRSSYIDWPSVQVIQHLTKQSDELDFLIKNYGTKTYQPSVGDEVIFNTVAGRIFAGNVVQIDEVVNGLQKELSIIVKDYSHQLDSQLVSKTYSAMTAAAIITDILTNFTDGTFTHVGVVAPITISNITFNYISVSECLKKLAAMLVNYDWYVDYYKDIKFFQVGTILSPFNLTDTSGNFLFQSLELSTDYSQIANEIYIRGGKVVASSNRTEYWSGDGTRINFPLANDFATKPTITVGGVAQTVGIDGVDADASYQFMWNQNSQGIRSTAGNTVSAGTNNIVIVGTPQFPLIYVKQNTASITSYRKKQKIITDKTITDTTTASNRADAEIAAYGQPLKNGSFITHNDGLVVGQYININSTIRGINTNFKIQDITIYFRTPNLFEYQVTIQTSNTVGINDILALLLIQNPANQQDNLLQNTTIQRVFDFPESMSIAETIHDPTQSSPPYLWGTGKWGLMTWHT